MVNDTFYYHCETVVVLWSLERDLGLVLRIKRAILKVSLVNSGLVMVVPFGDALLDTDTRLIYLRHWAGPKST